MGNGDNNHNDRDEEPKKPIQLTWAQVIWGVTVVFILGGLYVKMDYIGNDLRELSSAMTMLKQDTFSKGEVNSKESLLYAEISRAWEHIKDLEQSVYGKVKPK